MTYDNYPAPGEGEAMMPPPAVGGSVTLVCPVCAGTAFRAEEVRAQGRHGFSSFVFQAMICTACRHTSFFWLE